MPLYIGDYLASTARLTTEQHGAYLLLLMDYWRNGPLPNEDRVLAQITRLSSDAWSMHEALLKQFFSKGNDGLLHHKRADEERDRAIENRTKASDRARKAAEGRWANKDNAQGNAQALLDECPLPSPSPTPRKTKTRPSENASASRSDQRFSLCKQELANYWQTVNGFSMPWGAADAKQLSSLLSSAPAMSVEQFQACLQSRCDSEAINHTENPNRWLAQIMRYAGGSLDRFNRPKGEANGRSDGKTAHSVGAAAAAIAQIENRPTPHKAWNPQASEAGHGRLLSLR